MGGNIGRTATIRAVSLLAPRSAGLERGGAPDRRLPQGFCVHTPIRVATSLAAFSSGLLGVADSAIPRSAAISLVPLRVVISIGAAKRIEMAVRPTCSVFEEISRKWGGPGPARPAPAAGAARAALDTRPGQQNSSERGLRARSLAREIRIARTGPASNQFEQQLCACGVTHS